MYTPEVKTAAKAKATGLSIKDSLRTYGPFAEEGKAGVRNGNQNVWALWNARLK